MTTSAVIDVARDASHDRIFQDEIRSRFASAMSQMYRDEVPLYGTLLDIVASANASALRIRKSDAGNADAHRLQAERHGAIRVGTAQELHTLRRMFAVMGMAPVGYYDLSTAGVPVHSTAFRPISQRSLASNPFRVFTSLLRLELIADAELRQTACEILRARHIFTPRALQLTAAFERIGYFTGRQADEFVAEVLQTFKWHSEATVTKATYERLHRAHRLIADVVCFKGPHINHLTPRTLDIDAVQAEMPRWGILAKDVIEGPPRRRVDILLRQTSFKALEEPMHFRGDSDDLGAHTARFGEVEQRGMALTRAGRDLYDKLLKQVNDQLPNGAVRTPSRQALMIEAFSKFPDDLEQIRRQGLGYFRYSLAPGGAGRVDKREGVERLEGIEGLIRSGIVQAVPITYEDFLPVSAAGIFQSNLGDALPETHAGKAARAAFEAALGTPVLDEFALYEAEQSESLREVMAAVQGWLGEAAKA